MFSVVNVYLDQLKFFVVCVDGLGYVYVRECYFALDECDDSPLLVFVPCLCVWWCTEVFLVF